MKTRKNNNNILNYSDYRTTYKSFEKTKKTKSDYGIIKKMFREKINKNLSANNDYYTFINYRWLFQNKAAPLHNAYYTKYDDFSSTQDKVYDELIEIIKPFFSENKQIKNVFTSAIERSAAHDRCIEDNIRKTIRKIDDFIKADDLYGLLANINKFENISTTVSPIVWKLLPDSDNPTKYNNFILLPTLPVLNTAIYIDSDSKSPYNKNLIKKYKEFVNELFVKVIKKYDDHYTDKNYGSIMFDITKSMFGAMSGEKNDDKNSDSDFDFSTFFKKLGYTSQPKCNVENPTYLKNIMFILNRKWKTIEWRSFWIYIYVRQLVRSHSQYVNIYFNFYRKFIAGAESRFSNKVFAITLLSITFNNLLETEYVKKYRVQDNIDYVTNMTEDLKEVFIKMLKGNTWLTPSTKRNAIKKLEHLKLIVCDDKTNKFIHEPFQTYSAVDYWGNLEKIFDWRLKEHIQLYEMPTTIMLPSVNWGVMQLTGRQQYIVNAFYTPSKNDIFIPIAYMQKPFLDLFNYGLEYNVAYLGTTIAHELSHSLDNIGSNYDYTGKFVNWWKPQDRKKYYKKLDNVIKQYELVAARDNIKYNAEISVNENIADICAVRICENYLLDYQIEHASSIPNNYLFFTGYYTFYAVQLRQLIKKRSIMNELLTNPHALDKYRVNVPLSRLPGFATLYNIKPGDKMYWSTESIW